MCRLPSSIRLLNDIYTVPEVFYSSPGVRVLFANYIIKRELGVRILLGIFLSLSHFSMSFLVSV